MDAARDDGSPTRSFTALGNNRVAGTINDQNEIEFVQIRVANPVFGDMLYETRYGPYKEFGGVKFPTVIHHHEGDDRLNPGHNVHGGPGERRAGERAVQVRCRRDSPKVSARRRAGRRVESQKLAEGVCSLGGGSHNSVAVEFRDSSPWSRRRSTRSARSR